MRCERWREKFTDFVEDSLPTDQRRQLEDHLQQCPDCAQELAAFRRTVAALRELPMVPAPSDLPIRIRQALPTPQRVFGYLISWQAVGAVAAAACLLVGFWAIFSWQQPANITARRHAGRLVAPRPQPTEARREIVEAPEAEDLPSALPQPEAKPAAPPAVRHSQARSVHRGVHPLAAPSLKTNERVTGTTPPPASPGEAEVEEAPKRASGETGDLTALSAGSPQPTGPAGYGGRVAFGPGESATGAPSQDQVAGVKVTVTPAPDRVVGREVHVKVVIEPERDVDQVAVQVKPEGTLQLSTADAVVYRGSLKAGQQNALNFRIIATETGTQRLTVELSSDTPGIAASVPVSIPDFRKPQPATDSGPEGTEVDNAGECGCE